MMPLLGQKTKPREEKPPFRAIKLPLAKITKDKQTISLINDAVERTHGIVLHTTQFLKSYLLHLFETNQPFPVVDKSFLRHCMLVVSRCSTRGRPVGEKGSVVIEELTQFYNSRYSTSITEEKTDRAKITQVLDYEQTTLLTAIENNIVLHYIDYASELVNKTFRLKERRNNTTDKAERASISIEITKVKKDFTSPLGTPYVSDVQYHQWLDQNKPQIIFDTSFNNDPKKNHLNYHLKSHTSKYLRGMVFLCRELERLFESRHHCLPLRTSFSPCHITIDTTALIKLCVQKGSGKLLRKVMDNVPFIWTTFFECSKIQEYSTSRIVYPLKPFRCRDYHFHHMISTDGVSCSLLLRREGFDGDCNRDFALEASAEQYITDAGETYKNFKVVGIDPGREDLLSCTDGDNYYRYSAVQRRVQSGKKAQTKLLRKLKTKEIIEAETYLSSFTKKTSALSPFLEYVNARDSQRDILYQFYGKTEASLVSENYQGVVNKTKRTEKVPLFRKLKMNGYFNRQRSEAKMVNQIKKKFGSPSNTLIAIGDWEQAQGLTGKEPTIGKGLRTVLRKAGYKVFLVDEFRTSCRCHNCQEPLEKFHYRPSEKPRTKGKTILVHGLLGCKTVNGCGSLWNRDVNGCLNIRMLALTALAKQARPTTFARKSSY